MSAEVLTAIELRVLRSCQCWQAGDMDGRADALQGIDYRVVFSSCSKLRRLGLIDRTDDLFAGSLTEAGQVALSGQREVAV